MGLKRVFKWIGLTLVGVLGVLLVAAISVHLYMGAYLDSTFEIEGSAIPIPQDPQSIAEGQRLARIRGCANGCHGEDGRGQVFFQLPGGSQVVAPNVIRAAREWPVEDFERLVRRGVRPDGKSVLIAMPSAMFYHLSDEDSGAMIAWFRSLDPGNESLPDTHLSLPGRLMMFYYKHLAGTLLAAEQIDQAAPRLEPGEGRSLERGEYLAKTVCTECHGPDLRGKPEFGMPDLVVALAYELEDFRTLMRTGEALGGRDVGLMSQMAAARFTHFTDEEIDALHAWLQTLASRTADQDASS